MRPVSYRALIGHHRCHPAAVLEWAEFMKGQGIQRVIGLLTRSAVAVKTRSRMIARTSQSVVCSLNPSHTSRNYENSYGRCARESMSKQIVQTEFGPPFRSERDETYVASPADLLNQAGLPTVNVDVEEDQGACRSIGDSRQSPFVKLDLPDGGPRRR